MQCPLVARRPPLPPLWDARVLQLRCQVGILLLAHQLQDVPDCPTLKLDNALAQHSTAHRLQMASYNETTKCIGPGPRQHNATPAPPSTSSASIHFSDTLGHQAAVAQQPVTSSSTAVRSKGPACHDSVTAAPSCGGTCSTSRTPRAPAVDVGTAAPSAAAPSAAAPPCMPCHPAAHVLLPSARSIAPSVPA